MANKWKDIPMKSPFKTDEELIAELKQQISDIKHERDLAVSTLSMQLEEAVLAYEQMSEAYNRLREEIQDARDARDPGLA
jgi:DNA-binding transcriptional MocR family regulator